MIFLDNRKIFISGGAGVIGTELVKRLDKRGADLFVGDLKPIPKDFPKNIIYRQGDLKSVVGVVTAVTSAITRSVSS